MNMEEKTVTPKKSRALTTAEPQEGEMKAPLAVYIGAGIKRFSQAQELVLVEPVALPDLDILPTGEVYLTQIKYRQRLAKAFGPGGWALVPMGKPELRDDVMMREYALIAEGRYVSQAVGEAEYIPSNKRMSYATALEACKSNALMRCCKDVGIAAECWNKHFTEQFKKDHCVQVWRKSQSKPQWRRTDASPWYDEHERAATETPSADKSSVGNGPTGDPGQWIEIASKFEKTRCAVCGEGITQGERMVYNPKIKQSARHLPCHQHEPDAGERL